ncbi:hypothetical protein L9W92_02000 [Pelotomaculum terephthalicicum JT]|uniref:TM1266 family iron-only hydrogenase system putative regulator n=1 Tax=Pelotomaculum TaxID=191373 RepID=UPI0009C849D3|nr:MULTISPECIES: TM1266 family iron-only hydrogenase system putative regulator [Pelotomaculum]MCG9966832.1 hypothetical protein [Pelotomaculum terephthalicicum JT]OPX89606.1 MAG: hypothetical protein A4E54_00905 [Pelotomaculum sp. PtaB.Bin117]OPY61057.1 MAG: hypothetical protein A4E56_02301 [Pelotomaculum sp. PtaU1.Bin065]
MKRNVCIVGILVDERANRAPEVQQVLTRHGSQILSRNGIPDPGRQRGIITLTMQADDNERQALENDLKRIDGISVKSFCLADAVE